MEWRDPPQSGPWTRLRPRGFESEVASTVGGAPHRLTVRVGVFPLSLSRRYMSLTSLALAKERSRTLQPPTRKEALAEVLPLSA